MLADHGADVLLLDINVPTSPEDPNPFPILHLIPRLLERHPNGQAAIGAPRSAIEVKRAYVVIPAGQAPAALYLTVRNTGSVADSLIVNALNSQIDWANPRLDDTTAAEFGARCAEAARPIDDHRSTAAYRRHAVRVLVTRQARRAFPNG